jgi:receptor expression-enhancing protein 5/6
VFGFMSILEYFSDLILYWIPFYYLFKSAFILWLALPHTKGAEVVYGKVLKPFLLETEQTLKEKTQ